MRQSPLKSRVATSGRRNGRDRRLSRSGSGRCPTEKPVPGCFSQAAGICLATFDLGAEVGCAISMNTLPAEIDAEQGKAVFDGGLPRTLAAHPEVQRREAAATGVRSAPAEGLRREAGSPCLVRREPEGQGLFLQIGWFARLPAGQPL